MPRRPRKSRPPRPGRKLVGLDLGERRIGIAISDDTGIIASPDRIVDLQRGGLADIVARVREVAADGVVVGLPVSLSGDEGFQARATRAQAAELETLLDVPVVFWDETLTSAIADRALEQAGKRARDRRIQRDAIAAAIMLQSYLDEHPLRTDSPADEW